MRTVARTLILVLTWCAATATAAAATTDVQVDEYLLGPGDVIRITVFQNPDLTTEARVSESGQVSFPLVGSVNMGGASIPAAERMIADGLRKGGFVQQPQVNILPLEIRGNQVSVLGQVNKPGRYPLETFNLHVADMLAMAGGVGPEGADVVMLSGTRDGAPFSREIALSDIFARDSGANAALSAGDIIYVDRAPVFYIYGEVQKPGAYRLEQHMTLMQALATGGGLTPRGTERGMEIHRRDDRTGEVEVLRIGRNESLRADDVVYVKESLF